MRLLVIGATGLVGKEVVNLLEKSNFVFEEICFLASNKSRKKELKFREKLYEIMTINDVKISSFTHALTLTNSPISKQIIPSLLFNNVVVVDNSSAYRNVHDLTIPELNFIKNKRLYINPNCCIIQSIIPLFYINKLYNIKKIIYNTYQSCSGGGYELLEDFNCGKIKKCIVNIGDLNDDLNTNEEEKLIKETNKLLNNNIKVCANCVRVPVDFGHLVNVIIKVTDSSYDSILEVLNDCTIYKNELSKIDLISDVNVYTARLKQIDFNTYSFYTYANNLLRGAAYNSFKIIESILLSDE